MKNFVWENLKDLYCEQLYPHKRLWFTVDLYNSETGEALSENGHFGSSADPDGAVKMARTALFDSDQVKPGQILRVFAWDVDDDLCLCEVDWE